MKIQDKILAVKLLILDVDGVLTDGSVYVGENGAEFKRFSISDGAGIFLARAAGLKLAIVSGRNSPATTTRMKELHITDVYNGTLNKLQPYEALKKKYQLSDHEIAYVGDDLIDIPVMERVGVPIAVANAYEPVKALAGYITHARGGEGAVREAIDWLLKQQGRYDQALRDLRDSLLNKSS
ncbi:MAG: HAD-IIIA family hydrolase [FCB group bacterium]|nr:HAD-IIIA family hydrolase [FCB group bacterium]